MPKGDWYCDQCVLARGSAQGPSNLTQHGGPRGVIGASSRGTLPLPAANADARHNATETRMALGLSPPPEENKKFSCPFDACDFRALTKGNCVIHCLRVHFQKEMKLLMKVNQKTKSISCTKCATEFQSNCSFYYHCKNCIETGKDIKFQKLQEISQ